MKTPHGYESLNWIIVSVDTLIATALIVFFMALGKHLTISDAHNWHITAVDFNLKKKIIQHPRMASHMTAWMTEETNEGNLFTANLYNKL